MKGYLAQLPPLAWVGLTLPLLYAAHLLLSLLVHIVPPSVSNFLAML